MQGSMRFPSIERNHPRGVGTMLSMGKLASVVTWIVVGFGSIATAQGVGDLEVDLQRLVHLESSTVRSARARELARRRETSLDDWLQAMRSFGEFDSKEPGPRVVRVDLRVGDRIESTRIDLHVPKGYDPEQPAPLLLAFHGTGGDGSYMLKMWAEIADRCGMVVVAPGEAGANEGYAFSDRERQAALAALRWARLEFNVDEDRVYATGVSRGGHIAWDLALRYPGTLAAIAPMIGGPRVQPRQGQNNVRYLPNVLELPIRDLQGAGDDPGLVFNLKYAFERLEQLGAKDAELFLQEGLGHSFSLSAVDWVDFFSKARRDPVPTRVQRAVARADEGRAYWIEVLEVKKPILEEFQVPLTPRWKTADSEEQRVIIQEVADSKTGLVRVELSGPGRYTLQASPGVECVRLLLPQRALIEGQPLQVTWNGTRMRKKPDVSKEVLLVEFAERFDRQFLPVAEVLVR